MATQKNAEYKVHNGTDFDTINFKTILEQVKFPDGTSLLDFFNNGGIVGGPIRGPEGTSGQRFLEHTGVFNGRNALLRMNTANMSGYPALINLIEDLDNSNNNNGFLFALGNGKNGDAYKDSFLRPVYSAYGAGSVNLGSPSVPWDDVYIKGVLKATNGYNKLTNGFIEQWGVATVTGTTLAITLPIQYTTRHSNTQVTIVDTAITDGTTTAWVVGQNLTSITIRVSKPCTVQWKSIGY